MIENQVAQRPRPLALSGPPPLSPECELLDEIQQRVLWLAVRMVDAANRERATGDGVKVGGHQASSASMVSMMTAMWFAHLRAADLVSVKPHASPVFHAIQYLLGDLDSSYLRRLRAFGGLQSYPSRTKDPDGVDFSTGSVGLGAAAPLFAALTRRYVDAHFGARPESRFVALLGDAELDEGNVWEAIAEPAVAGLGNVMWVVDFNRQSLDRIVPGIRIEQWHGHFTAAGWHVVEAKYGARLRAAFAQPGGEVLRAWLDAMPNEQYQSLFGLPVTGLRQRFLDGAPGSLPELVSSLDDSELRDLVTDLGGHDLQTLLDAFAACDAETTRPSIVFAYTVKGWRLPSAGNPRNHSAMMDESQIAALRAMTGLDVATEWDRFTPNSTAGRLCELRRTQLERRRGSAGAAVVVPPATGQHSKRPISSQEAFGRVLVDLSRDPAVRPYLVTTAPDVATSTNLGGFINRTGVFNGIQQKSWSSDSALKWAEGPSGQHLELGISEMNLFLLLGQLGLAAELSQQRLLPVGTVYDPFVLRGLDAFVYSLYSGSRFVVAGTPSGVTLAPEGGAHQSTITASVGLELPGVTLIEPAYAGALDWLLCDALNRIGRPFDGVEAEVDAGAYYFRLTTRPIDQAPFEQARARIGESVLRRMVLAGGYRLIDAYAAQPDILRRRDDDHPPVVTLAASGAVMPEVLAAASELAEEGVAAHVVDVTSLDRLYAASQRAIRVGVRTAATPAAPGQLRAIFPSGVPIVTVHDAASHAMSWIGSAVGVPAISLGVDTFGQSGSIKDLYAVHDLMPGSVVNAALAVLALSR